MTESDKRIAPFGLRIPPGLKDRVQSAARHSNQSLNALIVSVLEHAFPAAMLDMHELAAFLSGVAGEAESGDDTYVNRVNAALASSETPWTLKYDEGRVIFYPYATGEPIRRSIEAGLSTPKG